MEGGGRERMVIENRNQRMRNEGMGWGRNGGDERRITRKASVRTRFDREDIVQVR